MFITVERANKITGSDFGLSIDDLYVAQAMIETYVGREESVIVDADDLELMGKATAYQAAYMKNNVNNVFEQAKVSTIAQDTASVTYKPGDDASPFIAPFAKFAVGKCSWNRSRSVHTGRVGNRVRQAFDWKRG